MNVSIGVTEFASIAADCSELYELAKYPSIIVSRNNYGWRQTNDLKILYSQKVLFSVDGKPYFDDGYNPQEILSKEVATQLNIDPALPGITAYVGKFSDKDDDQYAYFEVQANSQATHVLLSIGSFDDVLLPSQSDFAAFCDAHQAVYRCNLYEDQPDHVPHYLCILPITGEMIRLAVWHIWQRRVDERYIMLQYELYDRRYDEDGGNGISEIVYDCTIADLGRLAEGPFNIRYTFDIDGEYCKICRSDLYGEEVLVGEYALTSPDTIREYLASIVFLEGVSQPMSNFYNQP